VKRAIDVVGAIVGLLLSLPVLLVVGIAIRLDSPGRILFAHTRVGRNGRPFRCYKLRTMCHDAETQLARDEALMSAYRENGFKLPAHADHRVTALGRFLRTTSIDELPQFWNVLLGDMSLVGPRPIVAAELGHYEPHRERLLSMKPGLTGAWAVSGRSRIGYPHRASIELGYVHNWSIGGDLKILAQTVGVVLQRRGAY
jgi:exopolysaccharide production protein ExoY